MNLYCAKKMADIEFVRCSSAERSNFSEGSSEPKKGALNSSRAGAATPRVFERELLVVSNSVLVVFLSYGYKYN